MKDLSAAMMAHIQQDVTTLCTCWKVVCTDETVFAFTDHSADILYEGDLYVTAIGYQRTAIATDSQFSPDNLDVHGMLSSDAITAEDLRSGRFDYAVVEIFAVNYEDLTMGKIRLRKGWFGETERTPTNLFRAELRGIGQALSQKWGQSYTPSCRAAFGDERCGYPAYPKSWKRNSAYKVGNYCSYPAPTSDIHYITDFQVTETSGAGVSGNTSPAFNLTAGSLTTESGITWKTLPTFRRVGYVSALITNTRTQFFAAGVAASAGKFQEGVVHWLNGANHGKTTEIKDWISVTGLFELWLPQPYQINVGDRFIIVPGCDKRRSTCMTYKNILNYRGEPDVPGIDMLTRYPQGH